MKTNEKGSVMTTELSEIRFAPRSAKLMTSFNVLVATFIVALALFAVLSSAQGGSGARTITAAVFVLVGSLGVFRACRTSFVANQRGVEISNFYRRRRYAWSDVLAVVEGTVWVSFPLSQTAFALRFETADGRISARATAFPTDVQVRELESLAAYCESIGVPWSVDSSRLSA